MSVFHAAWMTFLISMVPVLELRGAIPVGVAGGLTPLAALAIAVVGNLLPVPILILFTRRVFRWLKSKALFHAMVEKLEARAARKSRVVLRYAWLGLFILVAIPLPGTGAWTGALVAALLDMRLKNSVPCIFLGVCIAATIMTLITFGVISVI